MTNQLTQKDERFAELVRIGCVIPRELAAHEIDLITLKWPTYRFMGPMAATRLFLREYEAAYKRNHAINRDVKEAQNLKIGHKLSFHNNNDRLTQLWKARQEADSLSIPYPDYFDFCFDFASRRSGRKYLPQPNQLGPKGKGAEAWREQFDNFWCLDRIAISLGRMEPMAQYTTRYRWGLPAQIALTQNLLVLGEKKIANLSGFVCRYMARLDYLQLEDFRFVEREVVQREHKKAKDDFAMGIGEEQVYPPLQASDLLQSCFGVPGVRTDATDSCRSCRLLKSCDMVRKRVIDQVIERTGSENPIEERKRTLSRERTRRFRTRQAALRAK